MQTISLVFSSSKFEFILDFWEQFRGINLDEGCERNRSAGRKGGTNFHSSKGFHRVVGTTGIQTSGSGRHELGGKQRDEKWIHAGGHDYAESACSRR
jgi:hypothetical protein